MPAVHTPLNRKSRDKYPQLRRSLKKTGSIDGLLYQVAGSHYLRLFFPFFDRARLEEFGALGQSQEVMAIYH